MVLSLHHVKPIKFLHMETKGIETRTRNVQQAYRRFTDEKKIEIVKNIINRPSDMTLDEACMVYGIVNSLYYVWKQKLGVTMTRPRTMTVPKSGHRHFSVPMKKRIIQEVENHPENVTKRSILNKYGVEKSLYYSWRTKYGVQGNVNPIVKSTVNVSKPVMNNSIRNTKTHTITLTVEVSSLIELVGFCNHIGQLPKVKTILSVE